MGGIGRTSPLENWGDFLPLEIYISCHWNKKANINVLNTPLTNYPPFMAKYREINCLCHAYIHGTPWIHYKTSSPTLIIFMTKQENHSPFLFGKDLRSWSVAELISCGVDQLQSWSVAELISSNSLYSLNTC